MADVRAMDNGCHDDCRARELRSGVDAFPFGPRMDRRYRVGGAVIAIVAGPEWARLARLDLGHAPGTTPLTSLARYANGFHRRLNPKVTKSRTLAVANSSTPCSWSERAARQS